MHPALSETLKDWRRESHYSHGSDWIFASNKNKGKTPRTAGVAVQDYPRPAADSGIAAIGTPAWTQRLAAVCLLADFLVDFTSVAGSTQRSHQCCVSSRNPRLVFAPNRSPRACRLPGSCRLLSQLSSGECSGTCWNCGLFLANTKLARTSVRVAGMRLEKFAGAGSGVESRSKFGNVFREAGCVAGQAQAFSFLNLMRIMQTSAKRPVPQSSRLLSSGVEVMTGSERATKGPVE